LRKRLASFRQSMDVSVTRDGGLTVDDVRSCIHKYWKLLPIDERVELSLKTLQEIQSTYNKLSRLMGVDSRSSRSSGRGGSWTDKLIDVFITLVERGVASSQDKEKLRDQLRSELEKVLAEEEGK